MPDGCSSGWKYQQYTSTSKHHTSIILYWYCSRGGIVFRARRVRKNPYVHTPMFAHRIRSWILPGMYTPLYQLQFLVELISGIAGEQGNCERGGGSDCTRCSYSCFWCSFQSSGLIGNICLCCMSEVIRFWIPFYSWCVWNKRYTSSDGKKYISCFSYRA